MTRLSFLHEGVDYDVKIEVVMLRIVCMTARMKNLIICFFALLPQVMVANESSVQWGVQPLKIKHQAGKDVMTEAGLYHFPHFMQFTHPGEMLNEITKPNNLSHLTKDNLKGNPKEKAGLPNVNLANLYGVKINYDIVDDVTDIDLTDVKKPEGETFTTDEVIAMSLECVRLTGMSGKLTILVNEKTKKWKDLEKGLQEWTIKEPIYTPKQVELKVGANERLYHWSYIYSDEWKDIPGDYAVEDFPTMRFPTFIRQKEGQEKMLYNGIGMSLKLRVKFNWEKEEKMVELNTNQGYEFIQQGKLITIRVPAMVVEKEAENADKNTSYSQMKAAIVSLAFSAEANGVKRTDYELKIIDSKLTDAQIKELLEFSKKEIK